MRFPLSFALALALVLGGLTPSARLLAQPKLPNLPPNLMAPTDALSPEGERKQFVVPDGFEVQLVASEPDIQKPIQLAFDAKGRLWVTTSYHYPFAAQGKATDKLFVLSDFDPATGKARKVQTFAADLNIPIGILPLPDCKSCIVSSVGEIRKYTDTDGDGKADKKEVLFSGFGTKDTHGMYNSYTLMPDGWVYACHGFSNDSTVKGKDGHEVHMQSGNTFRFRPDGSRIEVWTRGQVNPFGMAVDPYWNLYTADCHSKPITQLIPGAVYQSFGKPHDGLGFAPHVTDHNHGSTALCGLTWYDAGQFPKEYRGCMFLGNVVTNRINFDRIEWRGATPVAKEQPDFLTSKDRWFRPADIKLGPDGCLYVSDFYNKIIGHYEVPLTDPRRDKDRGRVWRIVWKGTGEPGASAPGVPQPKFHRPDFIAAKLPELIDDAQNNPNLTVRALATQQALLRLQTEQKLAPEAATAAFLTLTAPATGAKEHSDASELRHTFLTVRILASRPTWGEGERKQALAGLAGKSPKLVRAWVDAVIAHPHADFVKPVLAVLNACDPADTHLRHAAKIALRNCLQDNDGAWRWYMSEEERRKGFDPIYAEVALAVPTEMAASYLIYDLLRTKKRTLPDAKVFAAAERIIRYGDALTRNGLLVAISNKTELIHSPEYPDLVLGALQGLSARGEDLGAYSSNVLRNAVQASWDYRDVEVGKLSPAQNARLQGLIRVLGALLKARGPDRGVALDEHLVEVLRTLANGHKSPPELRVAAIEVLLAGDQVLLAGDKEGLKAGRAILTDPAAAPELRDRILLVFAACSLEEARSHARDALKSVPYRTAVPIGLALAGTKVGAVELFDAVQAGKAPARLLQEKAILERLKGSNAPDWQKRVGDLTKQLPPADQRIAELLKVRAAAFAKAKPDKAEGAKLFAKHCVACHKIGDTGGKIAPQLDGVGLRGPERLLEDVLDPNRNVDAAFRARSITLTSEKTLTALMLRVEGEVLVVADLEGKEQQIPLKEIATNRETMLSAMPANFADVIPERDLYHIVAYLLDQKQKEPPRK